MKKITLALLILSLVFTSACAAKNPQTAPTGNTAIVSPQTETEKGTEIIAGPAPDAAKDKHPDSEVSMTEQPSAAIKPAAPDHQTVSQSQSDRTPASPKMQKPVVSTTEPTTPKKDTPSVSVTEPTTPKADKPAVKPTEPTVPKNDKPSSSATEPTVPKNDKPSTPATEPTVPNTEKPVSKPTEPTEAPTAPTTPPTEPEPTQPPVSFSTSDLEAHGRAYAQSLGFVIDSSVGWGDSYYPGLTQVYTTQAQAYRDVEGQIYMTYANLVGTGEFEPGWTVNILVQRTEKAGTVHDSNGSHDVPGYTVWVFF